MKREQLVGVATHAVVTISITAVMVVAFMTIASLAMPRRPLMMHAGASWSECTHIETKIDHMRTKIMIARSRARVILADEAKMRRQGNCHMREQEKRGCIPNLEAGDAVLDCERGIEKFCAH